jgi:hypothetical protein
MKVTILICLVSGSVFQNSLFVTDPLRNCESIFKSMIKVDDDVNGYNELNRKMKIREAENE